MSESELHAKLVEALLGAITREYPDGGLLVRADSVSMSDLPIVFRIGGLRPDLWIRTRVATRTIVGEAKSSHDIDRLHTREQFKQFFEYLHTEGGGMLWIAVPLARAGEALRVAREERRRWACESVPIVVSGWLLGRGEQEMRWHA